MPTLNLDTAFRLPIRGIYEGQSFMITLNRFVTGTNIVEDWPDDDYELSISANRNGTPKLMTFTTTGGDITVNGNALTVTCLKDDNLMTGRKRYYYDLVATVSPGVTRPEGKGIIRTEYSISK